MATPGDIADLYEASLTGEKRQHAGVLYTPPEVVSSMCRLALDSVLPDEEEPRLEMLRTITVCDPSCGAGAFLTGMLYALEETETQCEGKLGIAPVPAAQRRQRIVERQLFGVDLSAQAVQITRFRLDCAVLASAAPPSGLRSPASSLFQGDALLGLAEGSDFNWRTAFPHVFAGGGFDLLIGNPPYVRHERIGGPGKPGEEYRRRVLKALANPPAGRQDLYSYFFALAPHLLRAGGVLCYVTSDGWLEAGYGTALQEFLMGLGTRLDIYQDLVRRDFRTAGIGTVVAVLRRRRRSEQGACRVSFSGRATPLKSCSVVETIEAVPPEPGKWGARYLRSTPALRALVDHPSTIPLSSLAVLRYGNKPGIREFFVLDSDEAARRGLEADYLVPALTSTRQIVDYSLEPTPDGRFFHCTSSLEELEAQGSDGAAGYIRWGVARRTRRGSRHSVAGVPWPKVRSVQGNRPEWHCLRLREPGHFVIPCLLDRRLFAARNPRRIHPSNMFFEGQFGAGIDPDFGCALLNSTPVLAMFELFGRVKGLGGLNLYGPDLAGVPVPCPTLFSPGDRRELASLFAAMAQRPIMRIDEELGHGELSSMPDDRRRIDEIVFSALVSLDRLNVYNDLLSMVSRRLEKGRGRKERV